MESVERITVLWPVGPHGYGREQAVLASEFDRVLAERNAFRDEARRLARLFDDLSKRVGFSEDRCQQTGESPGDCADALMADFDRVTAEREALQLLLNNRDDLDDQLTTLEQRRYAEQQAREAAERRVEELKGLLRRSRRYVEAAWPDGVHSYRRNSIGGDLLSDIGTALNPTAETESHE